MTQEFEGSALDFVQRGYGQAGVQTEQQAFLDDGNISQILDVKDSARRGRAPFQRGYFNMAFQNVHAVPSGLESFVDPYNPVNIDNGYPQVVDPNLFDVWVLNAQCIADIGANVSFAMVGVDTIATLRGPSDTAAGGAPALVDKFFLLAGWTDFTTFFRIGTEVGSMADGRISADIKQRWAPGQVLTFRSQVSGAVTVECNVTCVIVPVTLGQDLW